MNRQTKLLSTEFVAINGIVFLNYCNIALFFYYTEYLSSISIPVEWFGFLIAIFSLVILLIRPIISPFSTPHNSKKWVVISTIFIMMALFSYSFATSVLTMTLVRILHGLAYVVMTVAITSRLVVAIPPEKSSLAFSIVSVISLLPYALVPPFVVWATDILGSFPKALDLGAILMVITFPLLALVPNERCSSQDGIRSAISWKDVEANLKNVSIITVLLVAVIVWGCYAPVFFFLNNFGDSLGIQNPGLFFTISSFSEIAVRLFCGTLMDKGNKPKLMLAALIWLGTGYLAMSFVKSSGAFYSMGLFLGLGWGLIMPLLSSIVFDISEPKFRAFNTNMTFQMFQLGFFIGPVVGARLIQQGSFSTIFLFGALALFIAALCASIVFRSHQIKANKG